MKKILILTSKYLPNPSANGINTKYVVDELKKRKFEVFCISVKGESEKDFEIIEDSEIFRVSASSYSRVLDTKSNGSLNRVNLTLRRVLRIIKLFFLLPIFPNFDPIQSSKVLNKLNELYYKEKFDCIIGVFKPYSNIAALKKFKKAHSDVICIGYYLDLINSMQKPRLMPMSIYNWLVDKENLKSAKRLDASLIAISGKKHYSKINNSSVLKKIRFIDFPTFLLNHSSSIAKVINKNELVMTFAGTLSTKYRNPSIMLNLLSLLSKEIGYIKLNVYGKNDCKDMFIKQNISGIFEIQDYGLCSHENVLSTINQSDFLINISNIIQDAVPSKIFELFSTGKPIINLVFDKNDITLPYFERYPLVFNVEAWNDLNPQLVELKHFVLNCQREVTDLEILRSNFKMNTPEYTVDIIEEIIKCSHIL